MTLNELRDFIVNTSHLPAETPVLSGDDSGERVAFVFSGVEERAVRNPAGEELTAVVIVTAMGSLQHEYV